MLQAYYKETYTQVCSCEYCKIFKNSFFKEHLLWLLVHFIQMVSFFSLEKKQQQAFWWFKKAEKDQWRGMGYIH